MAGILTDTVTGNVNGTLIVTSRLIEEASQPPVPQQYSFHLNGMSRKSDFHDVPSEFALDNVEKRKLSEPPPTPPLIDLIEPTPPLTGWGMIRLYGITSNRETPRCK